MLIRLLPEQVSAMWKVVGAALIEGLPPDYHADVKARTAILQSVLKEEATVWVYRMPQGDGTTRASALVLTTFYQAPIFFTKHLLIYSFYAFENLPEEAWVTGFETLRKYADSLNLDSIIAYTQHPGIIRMAKTRLGAMGDYTLLEF